ncbi:unnamed protein product, partial [Candidula unifasciata]
ANPIFLEKIMLEYQEDGLIDNRCVNESTFDEQELTMSIATEDSYSKATGQSNKAEMYLSAVIAEHELQAKGQMTETGQDRFGSSSAETMETPPVYVAFRNGLK